MNAGAVGRVGGVVFKHRAWSPAADAPIAMEVTFWGGWGRNGVPFILLLFL